VSDPARPGSTGEHELQERLGTARRATAFYDNQVLDHLTPLMREFIGRQKMMFVATSDAHGDQDSSFRAGPPGFLRVIDEHTVMWPEYKGNGVMASMGNILENPHVGILMVDFFEAAVGLHVNGRATIVENAAVTAFGELFDRLPFASALPPVPDYKKTQERPAQVARGADRLRDARAGRRRAAVRRGARAAPHAAPGPQVARSSGAVRQVGPPSPLSESSEPSYSWTSTPRASSARRTAGAPATVTTTPGRTTSTLQPIAR
jgi:predicted pyridoxine 5'-phosphate oxidase superfamily flavin-nucleotide-binding protein